MLSLNMRRILMLAPLVIGLPGKAALVVPAVPVPEPSTISTLLLGVAAVGWVVWRHRNHS